MTGFFVLALAFVWLVIVITLSHRIGRRFTNSTAQTVAALATFAVLLPLPVVDELIGMQQFEALCREGAVLTLGVKTPEGRVTRYSGQPIDERVSGTAIPILRSHIEYHDVVSGELVAKHERYVAKGGVLIHLLGIFENNAPLIIGSPSCSAERGVALPVQLKFEVIN